MANSIAITLILTAMMLGGSPPVDQGRNPVVPQQPNVVFILADDLGYGDLGCYGATRVRTPHIDKLAAEGRLYTDAHAPAPVCVPSRYSLMTGHHFWRSGGFNRHSLCIGPEQPTIGRVMKSAGYTTACIGKWHLGFTRRRPVDWNTDLLPGPLETGFDYFFGTPMGHGEAPAVFIENHHVVGRNPFDPITVHEEGTWDVMAGGDQMVRADAQSARLYVQKAARFVRDNAAGPFFLYLATENVHAPLTPHPDFKGTSKIGPYGDYIHELDWLVGQVMHLLQEQGVADNTLVIFTSDNGGLEHPQSFDNGHRPNGELIGQKTDVWEGGHRVPMIARWPGVVPAGTRSGRLVSLSDMLATLSSLTKQRVPELDTLDSYDFLPDLMDKPALTQSRTTLLMMGQPGIAYREGDWVLIPHRGSGGLTTEIDGATVLKMPDLRYSNSDFLPNGEQRPEAPEAQLYNLREDPGQQTNLFKQEGKIARRLFEQMLRLQDDKDFAAYVARTRQSIQSKFSGNK